MNFRQTHMQVFTWPGKDVDMYEDFDGWTLSELRERVELVQDMSPDPDIFVAPLFCQAHFNLKRNASG